MAEVKPMMVKVEALKIHSTEGKEYQVGDTYEVPETALDNLSYQGMAVPVDRASRARKAAAPAKAVKAPKARKAAKPKIGRHKK